MYTTDDQGRLLTVFGSDKNLRYRIPFGPVDATIAYLREHASADRHLVGVLGQDLQDRGEVDRDDKGRHPRAEDRGHGPAKRRASGASWDLTRWGCCGTRTLWCFLSRRS